VVRVRIITNNKRQRQCCWRSQWNSQ